MSSNSPGIGISSVSHRKSTNHRERPRTWEEILSRIEVDEDGNTILKDAKTEFNEIPEKTKNTILSYLQNDS